MANENSKLQAQTIPLAKIHDLPGVFIAKQPDKTYTVDELEALIVAYIKGAEQI